jgi:hypothetical protein
LEQLTSRNKSHKFINNKAYQFENPVKPLHNKMTLRHLLKFDENIWYHRCMTHRNKWGLNPKDPYHIRLLEEKIGVTIVVFFTQRYPDG